MDSRLQLLSSYDSAQLAAKQGIRIWEAARATSAVLGYFDPAIVGTHQGKYIDGGMGANNPVNHTLQVAKDIWPMGNIACLVSIGPGRPPLRSVPTQLQDMTKYLRIVATDTEETEESFARGNRDMVVTDRYFRFNVDHGMEYFSSDEWEAVGTIEIVTREYLRGVATESLIEHCAEKLRRDNRIIEEGIELKQLRDGSHSVTLVSESQPKGSPTRLSAFGADQHLNVETFFSGQKGLAQVTDDDTLTGLHGQGQPYATRTGQEFLEENILIKDIAGCFLTDVEMRLLILTAYEKIGGFRLKKNLVILLEDFAERLLVQKLFGDLPNFVGYSSLLHWSLFTIFTDRIKSA